MATLFEANHNAGVPSDYWTTVTDAAGRLSNTVAAALGGTAEGLQIDYSATNTASLENSFTPGPDELRFRFRFDPNGAGTPTVSNKTLIRADVSTNGFFATQLCQVMIEKQTSGALKLRLAYGEDGSSTSIPDIDTTDAEHCYDVAMTRASSDVAVDGTIEFYEDGVSKGSVLTLDNYDLWPTIDSVFVWFSSLEAAMSGTTLYADEFILTDVSGTSLCAAALSLSAMTKPVDIDADGSNLYIALLSGSSPILVKFSTALDSDGITVFNPGSGTDIGVQCGRFDTDTVWVAGAFDGTNTVEKSEDAGTTFDVKDPATFGAVSAFTIGPDSDDRVLIVDDGVDIQETINSGGEWIAKNTGLTPVTKSLARLDINVEEVAFGNESGANDNVDYSVNTGADLEDLNLPVAADVSSIIVN